MRTVLAAGIAVAIAGLAGLARTREDPAPPEADFLPLPTRRPPFRFGVALLWALAVAACAGVVWATMLGMAWWLGGSLVPDDFPNAAGGLTILSASLGGAYGLLAGGVVGFDRGKGSRFEHAFGLGSFGMFFGSLGGVRQDYYSVVSHFQETGGDG